ncbi:PilW family protein [Pseudidiomarina andamanensis]|uniref:Prepilin-type N-terminal cleavage/methylation domain-containing protein n=1 Tax=Pseudidiomarina andamanensis TaxID=1940690 RepID=A0AA92EUP0_9GAMM|nr:prepilin-type N-terminal cleavage/methylation domain-containing protein [Pseudidiomarina andamanensis]MDS0217546.1 prepilin-type N-terminal cleavage/methylation domain-containing protein [Pseudidiomarina andamanensis]QGT96544.1 prepilin-type N-terminal cleavage/methylation domain-containing protein [Pseudidiomarina andamanensis]
MRHRQGFTLVELVIVIVLLAITGLFVFNYLGFGAQIFRDTTERDQLVAQSRFAIARLSRELQGAVPRSIRVSITDAQRCIEFMPILASSVYLDIPRPGPTSSDPFIAIEPVANDNLVGGYLLVYATNTSYIYGNSVQRRKVISNITDTSPAQDNLVEINYATTPAFFGAESPARRYFIGGEPVSWCYDNTSNSIYRFAGYGLNSLQPSFSQLQISAASSAEIMAKYIYNDLNNNEFPFYVFEATLQRNSLIKLDWRFSREADSEPLQFVHEVHIANVP